MKLAGELANTAQHLIRTNHLRNSLWRYERADLDRAQSGTDQRLDESDARLDADGSLFILQAVAWPHLDDAHGLAHADLTKPVIRPGVRLRRAGRPLARYRQPYTCWP